MNVEFWQICISLSVEMMDMIFLPLYNDLYQYTPLYYSNKFYFIKKYYYFNGFLHSV